MPGGVELGLWVEDMEWMLYLHGCNSGKPDDSLDQKPELKSIIQSLDLFTITSDSKHSFSQAFQSNAMSVN